MTMLIYTKMAKLLTDKGVLVGLENSVEEWILETYLF
jgi:hypothetical protein